MFGNLGAGEIFVVLLIVLLLFGAKRIPEIAGSMGKGIREFKKNMTDVERAIREPERDARAEPLPPPAEVSRVDDSERPEPKRLLS